MNLRVATDKKYKYEAHFPDGKKVKFGANGYNDYIIYNKQFGKELADQHKKAYIARHKTAENWDDPYSRGALSRWILWNKPTLDDSLKHFNKKFF